MVGVPAESTSSATSETSASCSRLGCAPAGTSRAAWATSWRRRSTSSSKRCSRIVTSD